MEGCACPWTTSTTYSKIILRLSGTFELWLDRSWTCNVPEEIWPPTSYLLTFWTLAKKKRKNTEMSSAGKKIEYSLTFLLFKEKKMFSSTPPSRIQKIHPPIFFSLFKKWKKRKLIQEDARPFQIKRKINWTETSYKKSKHATKNLLEKNLRTENSTFKKKNPLCFFC